MAVNLSDTKDQILKIIQGTLADAPKVYEDLETDFDELADTAALYAIRAASGDPTAKDILDLVQLRAETLGATIAARAEGKFAAMWESIFSVGVQGLLRGLMLALGVRMA